MLLAGCAFLVPGSGPMVVSKRLKWLMVGCLAMELLVIAAFLGLLIWLRTPRVRIADVEKTIGTSLPVGTPGRTSNFGSRPDPCRMMPSMTKGNSILNPGLLTPA